MADSYKMIAGIIVFVVFIGSTLLMAAQSFPELAPPGQNPENAVPTVTQNPVYTPNNCTTIVGTDWGCSIANAIGNMGNQLVAIGSTLASVGGMFVALLTFQIPAMQSSPVLQLLNFLIVIPIIVVLVLFFFRLAKSVIPLIGGEPD